MNDIEYVRGYFVVKFGTVVLILSSIVVWTSNPDEASFRRWFSRHIQQQSETPAEQLAGAVLSPVALAALDWERIDFAFFSVVVVHGESTAIVIGGLGIWHHVGAIPMGGG